MEEIKIVNTATGQCIDIHTAMGNVTVYYCPNSEDKKKRVAVHYSQGDSLHCHGVIEEWEKAALLMWGADNVKVEKDNYFSIGPKAFRGEEYIHITASNTSQNLRKEWS